MDFTRAFAFLRDRAGFVAFAGSVVALSRGLRKILKISLELQKDLTHALCGHEIESMVKQTFEEARDAITPDRRGEGRGRGRPKGRPRNVIVHELFNEPSPSTHVVPYEVIPYMAGPYSIRPMELLSRPTDGRPRRDVEADRLSYGSAIGDGYMSDMPITGEIGQSDILPTWVRPPNDTQLQSSCPITLADRHGLISQSAMHRLEVPYTYRERIFHEVFNIAEDTPQGAQMIDSLCQFGRYNGAGIQFGYLQSEFTYKLLITEDLLWDLFVQAGPVGKDSGMDQVPLLWPSHVNILLPQFGCSGIAVKNSSTSFQSPCRTTKSPREIPSRIVLPLVSAGGIVARATASCITTSLDTISYAVMIGSFHIYTKVGLAIQRDESHSIIDEKLGV
ncbi:hypothetical protein FXO38_35544 [Capsicum annuum]|nr:hypothetical protein FXO38_35544 [Capsicum annuum]KAF3633175.1 hypothetical protein FXO37_27170 [Capsicum annuum]